MIPLRVSLKLWSAFCLVVWHKIIRIVHDALFKIVRDLDLIDPDLNQKEVQRPNFYHHFIIIIECFLFMFG